MEGVSFFRKVVIKLLRMMEVRSLRIRPVAVRMPRVREPTASGLTTKARGLTTMIVLGCGPTGKLLGLRRLLIR